MADLMQQARELLAAEYERDGITYVPDCIRSEAMLTEMEQHAIRAIAAALRAAPEGFVLVRKEAIDWLNGETEEGFECPPDRYFRGEPPRYWWRSVFREKAGLAARPQGVKDGN